MWKKRFIPVICTEEIDIGDYRIARAETQRNNPQALLKP